MNLRGDGGRAKSEQKCGFPPPAVSAQHLLLLTVLPLEPSFPSPLCPFSALLTACGDCESDGFILLPFFDGNSFAQTMVRDSSITLIIVLLRLEEIQSA